MRILIVGSGAREHALAWSIAGSPRVDALWIAPGNPGTDDAAKSVICGGNVPISSDDLAGLAHFAAVNQVDLTVVGPEAPLAAGLADAFAAGGLRVFGPSAAAARLESSKVFSKDFMRRHGIPTARYATFTDLDAALAYVRSVEWPVVVKASGLAAGKGVFLPDDAAQAEAALREIMAERVFGAAGDEVVIEERLSGPEMSVMAFTDGRTLALMPPAQDYKRAYDGDRGPNTGGMGAFAPAPLGTPELLDEIRRGVLEPALRGMAAEGAPYVGALYAGLMLTADGPRVLEFNCRLGDPETEVVLPLLDSDLVEIMLACVEGRLHEVDVRWRAGAAATVVLASGGYPGAYAKGREIRGAQSGAQRSEFGVRSSELGPEGAHTQVRPYEGVLVFYAGTRREGDRLVTAGGRVLAVTGVARRLSEAVDLAYAGVGRIQFEGMQYRRDIAASALHVMGGCCVQ